MIRPTVSVGLIIVAGLVAIPSRTRPTPRSLPGVGGCPGGVHRLRRARWAHVVHNPGFVSFVVQYVLHGSPDGQSVCYDIQHRAGSAPSLSSAAYLAELVMLAPCGLLAVDQARAERHEDEQGIELSTGLAIATTWLIGVMVTT